jgi:hypothetical protein
MTPIAAANIAEAQSREWDGTTCITCGIALTLDTVWCEDHGPRAAEQRAEKAARALRPQGLAQWVDNPAVRNHLRRGILRLDEARAREGRPRFTENQARRVMIHIARHLLTLRETIAGVPRDSIERSNLLALLYKMIAQ